MRWEFFFNFNFFENCFCFSIESFINFLRGGWFDFGDFCASFAASFAEKQFEK
jgi:hypothetical protein